MEFICFINIFYRYGKKILEDILEEKGLSMQELIVLLVCNESPGIFQYKLIDFTGIDKSNLSKLMKRLEERDLIYRLDSDSSLGQKECYLTGRSLNMMPSIKEAIDEWLGIIMDGFDKDEIESYRAMSCKISDNIFNKLTKRW